MTTRSIPGMIMNGTNIDPAEIERTVAQHPAVREVATLPLQHPVAHGLPVCAVVLHEGTVASRRDLLAFVRARLGAAAPQAVVVLDAIPCNAQGEPGRAGPSRRVAAALGPGDGRASAAPVDQATDHEGRRWCMAPGMMDEVRRRDGPDALDVPVAMEGYAPGMHLPAGALRSATPRRRVASHLQQLEAESIHILREAVAEARKPVMLYSVGKDSGVMLHLARKAFYPAPPPFPLLHVDTRWKFREMYEFRDFMARESGMELLVHVNPEAIAQDINPFDHGSALHTDITKTEGLKQALELHGFDVVFGGARRDEEKSRAKERVFSFRTATHRWDPKNQRPELWDLYNTRTNPGESIRVFPLSNWTELDVWQYIHQEGIPVVPLYFAKFRPVVVRPDMIMMVDDARCRLLPGEEIELRKVRFRTLGCYPLTGAMESQAETVEDILLELVHARQSERQGRRIDSDSAGSMEKKKQEGYF